MDLSSLPVEMIASVAKYMNHVELVQLRKKSYLIDSVAKKCGIGKRMPVQKCRFDFDVSIITLVLDETVASVHNLFPLLRRTTSYKYEFKCATWTEMLKILDKIEVAELKICNCALHKSVQETLGQYRQAFRKCSSIGFANVEFACRTEEFTDFIHLLPKADRISAVNTYDNNYILNNKFISSRKWAYIYGRRSQPWRSPELDDAALDSIIANGTTLVLEGKVRTCFTVVGIAKALKVLASDRKTVGHSHWGFVKLGGMTSEEAFKLLREISDIQVNKRIFTLPLHHSIIVTVTFERNPNMSIEFRVTSPLF